MGSPYNPIGPKDPFDRSPIEGVSDKHPQEELANPGNEEPLSDNRGWLTAYFIQMLQKAIHFFLNRDTAQTTEKTEPKQSLAALKSFLSALKQEDRSEDVVFLNDLATYWNQAIEESFHFRNRAVSLKFKQFVNDISGYPQDQTHTFGYYLTEYAGQKWVPFPYMELVAKIHFEYQKNPRSSPLAKWTLLLDEILEMIKEDV